MDQQRRCGHGFVRGSKLERGPLHLSPPSRVSMPKHLRVLTAALALGLAAVWLLSCSKKNPASPAPPTGVLNGSLAAGGGTYAHTFTTAGSFNYHCSVHPGCGGLSGTIVVIPAGGTISNPVLAITQSGGSSDP